MLSGNGRGPNKVILAEANLNAATSTAVPPSHCFFTDIDRFCFLPFPSSFSQETQITAHSFRHTNIIFRIPSSAGQTSLSPLFIMLLPTFVAALHLATSFATSAAAHNPLAARSGSFRLPPGTNSHRVKRQALESRKTTTSPVLGSRQFDSSNSARNIRSLKMATRNEFIVKNGLSKREAAQSRLYCVPLPFVWHSMLSGTGSGDVDWCTSQDGVSAGCIVLCGVAVVFVRT